MVHVQRDTLARSTFGKRLWPAVEVALIFLVFFIHAGWPAPDVNEPHYLGKAKHYWDAAWCPADFFLNTADAHETVLLRVRLAHALAAASGGRLVRQDRHLGPVGLGLAAAERGAGGRSAL